MPKHRKDGNGTQAKQYQEHFSKIADKTSKGKSNKKKKKPKKTTFK